MTPTMFCRCVCLLGSVSLAEGFHVNVPTLPKLAALSMSTTAGSQASPVSTPGEEDGQADLFDWNKQVSSEVDRLARVVATTIT